MPITSYATLQDAVARWSGNSSDNQFATAVQDAIAMAEDEMDTVLRVPEMITRQRATATGEFESLPSGCLKIIRVGLIDSDGVETTLDCISEHQFPAYPLAATGEPRLYAIIGPQIRFKPAPTPDDTALYRITYFGAIPRLADDNPCTAVLLAYQNVYLYGALKHIAAYTNNDAAMQRWAALFEDAVNKANRAANLRQPALMR